jgi:hypothetical protein
MSRIGVGIAVDKLLTDEDLRMRFADDRIGTIAELCQRGLVLTSDEIDLLCQADPHLWFFAENARRAAHGGRA